MSEPAFWRVAFDDGGPPVLCASPAAALMYLRHGGARLVEGDVVALLELDAAQAARLAAALGLEQA